VPLRNLFYYEHFRPIRTSLRKTGSYVQETGNGLLQLLCALTIGAHKKDDDDAGEGIFFLLYGAYCTQQHAYVCSSARGSKEPICAHTHAGRRAFFSRPQTVPAREGCVRNNFPPAAEEKADVFKKEKDFFTLATVVCGSRAAGGTKFKMPFDLLFNYVPFLRRDCCRSLLLLITSTCWQ
jgi:hypothetical protein